MKSTIAIEYDHVNVRKSIVHSTDILFVNSEQVCTLTVPGRFEEAFQRCRELGLRVREAFYSYLFRTERVDVPDDLVPDDLRTAMSTSG